MRERVWNHDLRMGSEKLPEVDIECDEVTGLQMRVAYSPRGGRSDHSYEGLDSLDPREYHHKIGFPLIEDRDAIRQLREDYWQLRRNYAMELERGEDGLIRESSAQYYGDRICEQQDGEHAVLIHDTGHLFSQDCGSSRCTRESEITQLHRDAYRDKYAWVDDVCNNDLQFQSVFDRLESGQRYRRESDRAIDQGHDDYRQRTPDLHSASPSRGIPSWEYLQGSSRRGESHCYTHEISGEYQRDRSSHRLARSHGRPRSRIISPAKDGYLFFHTSDRADILKHRTESLRRHEDDGNDCFTKKRHTKSSRRYEDDGAHRFVKKRCTESLRRHEDDVYSEKGGKIKRYSDTHSHCNFEEESCRVRKSDATVTRGSVVCKTVDESLGSSKSNDLIRLRRHEIYRGDSNRCSSVGSEMSDRRSENCDVEINSRRMSRKIGGYNEKQLGSRKSVFHRVELRKNVNGSSRLLPKDKSAVSCRYFLKGYCRNGNRCRHSHGIESFKTCGDMGMKKSFKTKQASEATREMSIMEPSIHDVGKKLCSTKTIKSSDLMKNQSSADIDQCRSGKSTTGFSVITKKHVVVLSGKKSVPETTPKDGRPDKRKKKSGNQDGAHNGVREKCTEISDGKKILPKREMQKDCVNDDNNICGNKEGKPDDGCANIATGHTDVITTSAEQFVMGMKSVSDPSPPNLKNIVSDIPAVSVNSCVEVEPTVETSKSNNIADVPSASLKLDGCDASNNSFPSYPLKDASELLVVGMKSVSDPSPPKPKNIVSDIPAVSVNSCVEVEPTAETSESHYVADVPSASLKRDGCDASNNSCPSYPLKDASCPPCHLKDANDILVAEISDNSGVNADSHSSGVELSGAQKALFVNGCEKSSSVERPQPVKSVEAHSEIQPELQEENSCASAEERDKGLNVDRLSSYNMDKKSCLCQNITCDTISCYEKSREKTLLRIGMHDNLVDDDTICGNQSAKVDDGQKMDISFVSCEVNHREDPAASNDQVEQETLAPLTSNANSASPFEIQAVKEASFDDIALDMSLDRYICESLSLENFVRNMEDDKATTIYSWEHEEPSPLLVETIVGMRTENPIQFSNEYLQLPSCDGFCETKPIAASSCGGLNPERIAVGAMLDGTIETHNEAPKNEQEKRHATQFKFIDAGKKFMEENNPHYIKEPSSFPKDKDAIPAAESFDNSVHSLSAFQNSETIPVSSSLTSGQELAASIEANEKQSFVVDLPEEAQKLRCCESHVMDYKGKEGNQEEDEKRKQIKRPAVVKLEQIDAGNKIAETNSHFNVKERNVILTAESLDKYFGSRSVGQNSDVKPIPSLSSTGQDTNFETIVLPKSWDVPSLSHSAKYDPSTSAPALDLKVPTANLQVNEKCSSIVYSPTEVKNLRCCENGDMEFKGKVSNQEDDDKLLLRLAVLELAKKILDPLWEAGRITSKDIYKTITRKVVDKVASSVHGVKVPRTKENVDRYLIHHKPRIAHLVLAYVNMHPVQL